MKHSWIKLGTKPMRRVSKRRARHMRSPDRRAEFEVVKLRSKGICERIITYRIAKNLHGKDATMTTCWPSACHEEAIQMHHVLPKGRGGKDHRDNLLHLCLACHQFTLDYPREATLEGTLK